jgi:hypothetical protein
MNIIYLNYSIPYNTKISIIMTKYFLGVTIIYRRKYGFILIHMIRIYRITNPLIIRRIRNCNEGETKRRKCMSIKSRGRSKVNIDVVLLHCFF